MKSGLSSVLSSVTGATGKAGNFGETVGSLGEKVGNINMDEVKDIHNKTKRLHRNAMVKLQESVSHFSGNKNMFVVFVMLVLIGISAIGYAGYNYQQQNAMLDEVYVQVDEMKDNLERAKMRIIYDKKGAQKLLVQLQKDINAIIDMGLPIDLDDLAVDIQENLDKAANIARVNPEAIASLENVRADVDLRGFENIGGQMIAYDYNAYYSVVLDEVNTIKVSDNADMIASTYFDDQSSVLFYSQDKSIWELKNGALTTLSTTDDVFKNAVAFDDFRQYVYFLDPESNQIWKYMRNNSGFAGAVEYNQGTDLSRATDIAIDGHIYISTQDGNIIKMLSAQQIPFEFSNLPEKILVIDKIETTVDSDYLYILISDEKKIIKVTKDGDYRKEYVFEIDESLVDLHIDENSGKLFVLSTSYLYSINL
ncbi:MAG: hypothetical protein U9Q15_04900 [Patescibacteria group bacterium]|nr:hypothetical protein [Patescibacteria group bacterium]